MDQQKESKDPGSDKKPVLSWLREIATVIVIALVLSLLIKTFLARAFFITSTSMVTTLEVNDRIFVNLLVPESFDLTRGDVVVFRDTKGWLPEVTKDQGPGQAIQNALTFVGLLPDTTEQHLIKRIIGLPGDRVMCCGTQGKLTINGTVLDETYINPADVPNIQSFDVVVPEGKVWVLGDNRNNSADSRAHVNDNGGFVDITDIEGKATIIAWPLNRITILDNHPTVFENIPHPQ